MMTNVSDRPGAAPGEEIGFVGLGVMGQPMALNLAKAGARLVVWNRSPAAADPLREAGAAVAAGVDEVFECARIVILMLVNEAVLDEVLLRGTPDFAKLVSGHIVVSMGSNPPDYSRGLAADIIAAGGRYVEAPVSGSRKPAEMGQLVALLGGDAEAISEVRPLLAPMCRETILCGPVGNALLMKLTVNLYLCTMLAGLAEAAHFAESNGLDLKTFQAAIDSGPMASDLTRVKIPKLVAQDFSVQAATADAFNSTKLIAEAARAVGMASPVLDLCRTLYGESVELGNGRLDMVSVVKAIEARTAALGRPS
ncbi:MULTISPECIES: NAD(P)-dependent oxidoreductase [unclassified Rhizobium]|jgi:3-hydroxyisobutyrate dehydrogenase|uniref:NAD(P)-dependent oxidoreductase n=1 Tax=unclassified Rhizobium TaxID=2613769 RepID=UPI0009DD8059|nr:MULTISPECIES: NAD(P)-dependent oxidoreductase [unclassified Rhizobium]MBN8949493.1 NAD(P)-dependent oxidoreductase [Rhizobium tropici]